MMFFSNLIALVTAAIPQPYRLIKATLARLGNQMRCMTNAAQSLLLIGTIVLLSLGLMPAPAALAQEATFTATLNPQQVVEYALTLEKLEADFYRRAIAAVQTGRINAPPVAEAAFVSYGEDEQQHVADLSAVLQSLGGNPEAITIPASPVYTAILGRDPFANLADLLLALQYVEDLGAAAYKGQVQNLQAANADTILAGALEIHTVEARHAAGIRFLRQTLLGVDVRPWIRSESEVIYNEVRSGFPIPFENEAFDGFATEGEVLKLVGPILATAPQAAEPASSADAFGGSITQQDCPAGTTLQLISGGFACMF